MSFDNFMYTKHNFLELSVNKLFDFDYLGLRTLCVSPILRMGSFIILASLNNNPSLPGVNFMNIANENIPTNPLVKQSLIKINLEKLVTGLNCVEQVSKYIKTEFDKGTICLRVGQPWSNFLKQGKLIFLIGMPQIT